MIDGLHILRLSHILAPLGISFQAFSILLQFFGLSLDQNIHQIKCANMLFYRTSEGARASRGAANRGGFLNVRDEDGEQKRHAQEPGQGHHEVHHVKEELQPGDDQQQQEPTETDAGVGELQRRGLGQRLR